MNVERLIKNAETALQTCETTGCEWGIRYWGNVLQALLRKARSMD